jgi:hypothetical protein
MVLCGVKYKKESISKKWKKNSGDGNQETDILQENKNEPQTRWDGIQDENE